jgi:hypothetical protein
VVQAFGYDQSTCTYDAASSVTQYGRVRQVSGSDDVHFTPNGYAESYYSNGFSQQGGSFDIFGTPINYTRVLNGVLLARLAYDTTGREVSRTVNGFDVRTRAQSMQSGEWRNVAGAWFVAVVQLAIRDGVQTRTDASYDNATGQQIGSVAEYWNSEGSGAASASPTTVPPHYPVMATSNMLSQMATETTFSTVGDGDETIVAGR